MARIWYQVWFLSFMKLWQPIKCRQFTFINFDICCRYREYQYDGKSYRWRVVGVHRNSKYQFNTIPYTYTCTTYIQMYIFSIREMNAYQNSLEGRVKGHLVLSHFGTCKCSNVETNISWTCLASGLLSFEHPSVLLFLLLYESHFCCWKMQTCEL